MDRRLFRDPPPLPSSAPAYIDEQGCRDKQAYAKKQMRGFDDLPAVVRHVTWVAANVKIADFLVQDGYTTPETAEPVVRKLLERNARRA